MNGINYLKESGMLSCDGTSVLSYYVKIPKIDTNKKIDVFYQDVANSCIKWVKERLFIAICEEYHSSNDKNKRFGFGYRYSLEGKVIFAENGLISVIISAELKKKSEKSSLVSKKSAQVWDISSGRMLPIDFFADKKSVRKYKRLGGVGYYINQKGLKVIAKDGSETALSGVDII